MPVDRGLWKRSLGKTYAPSWPCPHCPQGTLRLAQDTLNFSNTVRSGISDDANIPSSIWDIEFAFSAFLKCDSCKEVVSCCGDGGYTGEGIYGERGFEGYEPVEYFHPRYFSQALHILPLHPRWPKPIRQRLKRSFLVFFCDLDAAANHVRSCVEELLTILDIPISTKSGSYMSLQRRICIFKSKDAANADRAEALKWIGNTGSHGGALTKDELFDAYDILDVLLEDLYVGHYRSVAQKVNEINQRFRAPQGRG
jgi:Domain of unknown function (DUF4145)